MIGRTVIKHNNRFIDYLKAQLSIRPPVDQDPRLHSPTVKNGIILIVMFLAALAGFSCTIYYPGIPNIITELNSSPSVTTLVAALFMFFMGVSPVFFAALSDFYQIRRFLLIISMVIFVISSIASAVINNIWWLVVFRCLQAIGASASQSVGPVYIADLYPIEQRGRGYSKFVFGNTFGPLIGPMVGGFLVMTDLTWRATFWLCAGLGGIVLVITVLFMPETYRDDRKFDVVTNDNNNEKSPPVPSMALSPLPSVEAPHVQVLDEQQDEGEDITIRTTTCSEDTISIHQVLDSSGLEKQQRQEGEEDIKKSLNLFRPFALLRYPNIALCSFVGGVAFGTVLAIETVIPILYKRNYGFNSWQTGLCYLGGGLGNICGVLVNSQLSDRLLLRARGRRGGREKVEDRLTFMLWPCLLIFIPVGALLFGWSMEKRLSYWAPIVAFGIQTFGMNQVMTGMSAYLLDAVPGRGASAVAAGNVVYDVFACFFAVAGTPMVGSIGPGYLSVFVTGLSWLAAGGMVILKMYGQRMRRRYGFLQDRERKD